MSHAPNDSLPLTRTRVLLLFAIAVFWSALLLFILEPLFAKMILPLFGGSPSVWLTCMVFFQACLLLGYLYSHFLGQHLTPTRLAIHLLGLAISCISLPITIHAQLDPASVAYHPSGKLLLVASASIGLPFFFLATSAPLLQRWFSHTSEPSASNPYFLYAASNTGSLVGLASYPLLIEPRFTVTHQTRVWSVAYVMFALLIAAAGILAFLRRAPESDSAQEHATPPSRREQLLWIALAFVPASLLYSVTSQLSIDFPPVPMLWVVPLAIYLLSFILGFSAGVQRLNTLARLVPISIVAAAFLFAFGATPTLFGVTGIIKLLCFAGISFGLHAELSRRRPATTHLTRFYLLVSFGGVLAGVLTGLVAPVVFSDFTEYPVALLATAVLLPFIPATTRRPLHPAVVWTSIGILAAVAVSLHFPLLTPPVLARLAMLLVVTVIALSLPTRLTVLAVLVLIQFSTHLLNRAGTLVYHSRSFYGVYKVLSVPDTIGTLHYLQHGTTTHGAELFLPNGKTEIAPTYYAPVADLLATAAPGDLSMGVVGLGTGTSGCFASPASSTTFFEIDPLVESIARDQRYFTYLTQCPGKKSVVLGDARLTLAQVAPASFDVLVLDAFSSDAIPLHLLTREAFELYRRALKAGGFLMVHVSNRFIDIQPVVQASAALPGYTTLAGFDSNADISRAHFRSKWIAVVPKSRASELQRLGYEPTAGKSVLWTDDFSSLVPVVNWRRVLAFRSPH